MGVSLLWFLSLMVHLSLGSSAPDEGVPQYTSTCPDGWTQVGRHCFSVNEDAVDADVISEACNQSVATIRGMEQNNVLKGIVKEPTWINAKFTSNSGWVDPVTFVPLNFSNPERQITESSIYKCGLLTPDGTWDLDDCREATYPTLCQRSLECVDGWYGDKCMDRCHCFIPGCNVTTGECPYGCEVGWTGPSCNIRQKKPEARYHCMRDGEEYHMILRVDNHGIFFRSVNSLDSKGKASSKCTRDKFTVNEDGPMLTYIHGNDTQFSPDCSAQKVGDNEPVYEWTFRLQQYEGVLSPFDTDVKVRCNFSDADGMVVSTVPIHVERKTQPPEVVTPRHVSGNVMIVDAKSGEEVNQVAFGQEIQIVVPTAAQNVSVSDDRSRIGLLSPRNCEAKSPDGKFVKKMTDANGCDVYMTTGGFTLKGDSGEERRMSSQAFSAFAFAGYSSLTFSCDLKPCYNPVRQDCVSPCGRNRYGRSADNP
ncbi:uncharacterized protein LOC124260101 [Haliotis rubra]|uniref:uncharacterized protein LOC124260101 n=1 Tax=Haliotis rubra TaxID=36100 RepID=UPI001EE58117|nr:uncharacterized protein LOC124260101 [Haliotis rubra]